MHRHRGGRRRSPTTRGALVVVDNTFATPYLQQPLALGADVVVHSATKYLGGHSDVVGGFVAVDDDELAERLRFTQNAAGAVPAPFDCYLVLRGVKTLAVRMDRHCANARAVVDLLVGHPAVERVLYPQLPDHPGHAAAAKQMRDFGGMVSASRCAAGEAAALAVVAAHRAVHARRVARRGREPDRAPGAMTHASAAGSPLEVPADLVRLSVGIESAADLVADLRQALDASPRHTGPVTGNGRAAAPGTLPARWRCCTTSGLPAPAGGHASVTIGAYDGVHLGHQAVIAEVAPARRRAAACATRGGHLRPPPGDGRAARVGAAACSPTSTRSSSCWPTPASTTPRRSPSTRPARRSRPRSSCSEVLVDCLDARAVVVGEDFHFGHQRAGNVALLREMGAELGFEVEGLELVGADGAAGRRRRGRCRPPPSAHALVEGDLGPANAMLGRPHEVRGVVAHGDERGRELGFPTANVRCPATSCCRPTASTPAGTSGPTARCTPAAISLGRRPDVLRGGPRQPARGPPARLRRRPLRRARPGALRAPGCGARCGSTRVDDARRADRPRLRRGPAILRAPDRRPLRPVSTGSGRSSHGRPMDRKSWDPMTGRGGRRPADDGDPAGPATHRRRRTWPWSRTRSSARARPPTARPTSAAAPAGPPPDHPGRRPPGRRGVCGRGVPLVVVHGFSAEGILYAQTLSRLVDLGFKVIAIDTAGHGGTQGLPTGGADLRATPSCSAGCSTSSASAQAVLAGHSMGGRLVTELAAPSPTGRSP